jgi:hypothetical protein
MNQRPPMNQRRQPPPPGGHGHGRRYGGRRRGCYVATACYGSYYAPQVLVLRRFRDEELSNTLFGRIFIQIYYFLSPFFAEKLKDYQRLNTFIRTKILDKIVNKLKKKY